MPERAPYTRIKDVSVEPVVRARGLCRDFETPGGVLQVLRGVDLEVVPGEMIAIVGASGSGKSTLLHLLGGLDRPTSGSAELEGTDLAGLDSDGLAAVRNRTVGFVFQFHHLLWEFSARENVALPALMAGRSFQQAMEQAGHLLTEVGLRERAEHRPGRLSGGEKQRVAVARALVMEPRIVLADEPSGNLDRASSEGLHELLWGLNERNGQTFLLVTHDAALAQRAGRVLQLSEGRLGPRS